MPVGLPPNFAYPMAGNWINGLKSQIQTAIAYFEIPSLNDVYNHTAKALHDSYVASKSIHILIKVTTRPLCILIALISHYLCIFLKVLADCTIQHVIIALREGWKQAYFAFNWFVQFQKGLSRAAILIEFSFICIVVALCALWRHIKKKKYAERTLKWYNQKRKALQMKYEIFVDGVAQTSMVLALLLPHVLYSLVIISVKYVAPALVRYLATKTFLVSIISVYYPILKTINSIHRCDGMTLMLRKEKDSCNDASLSSNCGTEGQWSSFFPLFRKKKSKADKYIEAASQSDTKDAKKAKMLVVNKESDKEVFIASCGNEQDLNEEITELLKYWFVFAFLTAFFGILSLLPLIGRIFSNSSMTQRPSVRRHSLSLLKGISLSQEFIEEAKLVFFVWLNLLPCSSRRNHDGTQSEKKGDAGVATVSVKKSVFDIEKKATSSRKKMTPFTSRPLDILYEQLSPVATSLVQSSSVSSLYSSNKACENDTATREKSNENNGTYTMQSIIMKAISSFRSFLDVLVWSKIISDDKKSQIISIMVECVDIIPVLATLFMPSYFTSFGVIYVRLVVPGAKSAHAHNTLQSYTNSDDKKLKHALMEGGVRYLKYWVLHFFLVMILTSFSPILDWIPLVTHIKWILWAYVHLEASTLYIYGIFSRDLEAFGLLTQHTCNEVDAVDLDINDTVVAKLFQLICDRLPSGSKNMNDAQNIVSIKKVED